MLPVILSICLSIFAIAVLVTIAAGTGKATRVNSRLAALDRVVMAPDYEERIADIRREQHKLTAIPWLNYWLNRMNLAPACSLFLYQAGVELTIGALLLTSIAGSVVAALLLYIRFNAALPALLLSTGFFPLPFLYVRMKRTMRLSRLEQQLPEALGMMVSALRVGHSLIAALGAVAQESPEPIGGEMRKCFEEQNYGVDLRTALVHLTARAPIQDFRIFVAAVMIQKESGGNLAEVLEKVVHTTRERFRLKKQVSVHTAQARMTGWVLSILPVALGIAMYMVNPDGVSILWKRPVGLKMLYASAGMDIAGALIIRKIVGIEV
ncbi:MAG: type II secretion system F family protein [Bryobacteraceae bacterium]|jgi:tight adherence protein B